MSTGNNSKVSDERRGDSAAIGNIPDVHANTSITQTVTLSRDGTNGTVYRVDQIFSALESQNDAIKTRFSESLGTSYQMYIHAIRLYGVSGGFISLAPFPHRQYFASNNTTDAAAPEGFYFNIGNVENVVPRTATVESPGQLTQMYDFGVEGSSRPHLSWKHSKVQMQNNPFFLSAGTTNQQCVAAIVQSRGFGIESNDNHIIQFDVTVQPNKFIVTNVAFGASLNFDQLDKGYRPNEDKEKRIKEAVEADEIRLKKRKIKHMKDLTMPVLDSH